MDVKVRETSCCGAVLYCSTLVLVVLCLCGGPILLSKYAAPALRDYLQQERHHMTATCSFTNYTFTGDQPCTYKVSSKLRCKYAHKTQSLPIRYMRAHVLDVVHGSHI